MSLSPAKKRKGNVSSALEKVLAEAEALPQTRDGWDVKSGLLHLIQADSQFVRIIEEHGIPSQFREMRGHEGGWEEKRPPFHSLLKTIIFQQLAGAIAEPILQRVLRAAGVKEGKFAQPEDFHKVKWEVVFVDGKKKVRANGVVTGLSENKYKGIVSLTEHFLDPKCLGGGLDIASLPAPELRERLLAVRGLGPWSVDMFSMFSLQKADIFPVGDLAVKRAAQRMYGIPEKDDRQSIAQLLERTACWSPYSTLGSCYMWKLQDSNKAKKKKKKEN